MAAMKAVTALVFANLQEGMPGFDAPDTFLIK